MTVEMDEFDYNFSHLSPAEFIMTCGTFADSLLSHEYFSKNWVDFVTHPQQLKARSMLIRKLTWRGRRMVARKTRRSATTNGTKPTFRWC